MSEREIRRLLKWIAEQEARLLREIERGDFDGGESDGAK